MSGFGLAPTSPHTERFIHFGTSGPNQTDALLIWSQAILSFIRPRYWSLVVVPPHSTGVCSSLHIYLCQPNKMTYRISALLRGLGRCCFLFNPRERSIYYRLYDLSPHLFLQVVFLVNIYFFLLLGIVGKGGNSKVSIVKYLVKKT